jgi:peptidoglycan-associated lipoprotein
MDSSIPGIGSRDINEVGTRPGGLTAGDLMHGQFAAVYFDYDSARVRPSELSKLEAVASFMKSHPGTLVIEGHTDERGTAEYNRALGERRAGAIREQLARLGVDSGHVSTISYGKDKPADLGHDDTAHAKNRRAEFGVTNS